MTTRKRKRGERLSLLMTAKDEHSVVVDLSAAGYSVDSWLKSETTGRVLGSMSPTITGTGRISLDYDTVNLSPGNYPFDVRITKDGADVFTQQFTLEIEGTVTTPSPR